MEGELLIIIPCYNEEASIIHTVRAIEKYTNFDYIVIDDGSTDRSLQLLEEHEVPHIPLPFNLGIGGAMQTGYKYAYEKGYTYAVQLDADGQHDPREVALLLQTMQQTKADMIIGSRFVEKTSYKGSFMRRLGIFYFYLLIYLLTRGLKVTDPTSGFRIVNRSIIKEYAHNYPHDYPEVEVLITLNKKGYVIQEVSVNMHNRKGGVSSITPLRSIYYMIQVTYIAFVRALL